MYGSSSSSSAKRKTSEIEPIAFEKTEAGSFRDPGGRVVRHGERILRFVGAWGEADFTTFLGSNVAQGLVTEGKVVSSRVLNGSERAEAEAELGLSTPVRLVIEHELIRFPSYPYEWCPQMLYEAGMLTVDMAMALLEEGLGLKDATPYNILFRGPRPVFIDVLSIEKRDPLDAIWLPYAQFIRTFCIPLLINKQLSLPIHDLLIGRRDGLEPEEVRNWLGTRSSMAPGVFSTITIPAFLGRFSKKSPSVYAPRKSASAEQAAFTLKMHFRRAKRLLKKSRPSAERHSEWSDYDTNNTYDASQTARKEEIIRSTVEEFGCRNVLDVGCNTGRFSIAALRGGACDVVATDRDPAVIDRVFQHASEKGLPILPLVVNFARPSSALGWRNSEELAFFSRAAGKFDCVMALAFIHHMLVSERVPLPEFIGAMADLTTNIAIIEFVAPEDEMFQLLLRGRGELHRGLNAEVFEQEAGRRFEIVRTHVSGENRRVYVLRKY